MKNAPESKQACAAALRQLRQGARAPMAQWLRSHLFEHVLPFWEPHAREAADGLSTCVSDTGAVLSTDKWLWSQWRAVWVFSRIYNRLDPTRAGCATPPRSPRSARAPDGTSAPRAGP